MKFCNIKKLARIGLLGALCLSTAQMEAILASTKATAMAAAVISTPVDALAAAYNPAGMVEVGDRFDLGAYWVQSHGKAIVSGNLAPAGINGSFNPFDTKNAYAGDFGINKTFCTEIYNQEIEYSLGLVAYDRNYQKTTYAAAFPLLGDSKLGLEYAQVTIAPTLAFKWNECHSFGIAFNVQIERIKLDGLQNFDNALLSSRPGHVTNRGYDYSAGFTPTLGWLWHINDQFNFGLTYQPKTKMSRLTKYDGFVAQRGRLDVPQKIGAGISWRFLPNVIAAFDVEHIDWCQVKALKNNLIGEGGVYNQLGTSHGPGFGFQNQLYYRFGLEYQVNECWTVRAGYRWARSPVKKSQTAVNLLTDDCSESFLTCGATWNYDESNEISGLFAYGFEHTVNGTGAIPLVINTTPITVLGGGNVKLKESKLAVGISWGHRY